MPHYEDQLIDQFWNCPNWKILDDDDDDDDEDDDEGDDGNGG